MAKVYYESSKTGQGLIERMEWNEGTELNGLYNSYSYAKAKALEVCKRKCFDMDGYNFHICSHNTWQFTVAWETDEAYYMETANHSYVVYKNW